MKTLWISLFLLLSPSVARAELVTPRFTQGSMNSTTTTTQEIVEEIVILSDYGKKIVDAKEDENGMVPWYKVEADVYNITDHENMDKVGKYPKVYVYRVIPFKVHVSKFQPATKSSPGIANLKRQACKKYDYIYTGQNDDILEFNINFDVAFFTAITPFGGANKAGSKDDKEN